MGCAVDWLQPGEPREDGTPVSRGVRSSAAWIFWQTKGYQKDNSRSGGEEKKKKNHFRKSGNTHSFMPVNFKNYYSWTPSYKTIKNKPKVKSYIYQ